MSIVNAWASESKAVLCVDTLGSTRDGGAVELSKMWPFVHSNVMLAVQGSQDLLSGLFFGLNRFSTDNDFDALERFLPDAMQQSVHGLVEQLKKDGVPSESPLLLPSKLFLAGWSASRRRMCVLAFQLPADGGPAVATEAKPWLILPGNVPALQSVELRPTDDCFMEIARAQERAFVGQPGAVIGGRLVVAEITRDAMAVRCLGSL